MSSLNRYKKSGGFIQLLSLIETFGPQKRDKFLEMIEAESAVWGKAIRERLLTIERIFSWPDQVVIEIIKNLPIKSMAVVLGGLKDEQRARMMVFFTPSDTRRMQDALIDKPKPEETAATMVKFIETTRKMLNQSDIRAEKFDEGIMVPEDFESKLEAQADQAMTAHVLSGAERAAAKSGPGPSGASDAGAATGSSLGMEAAAAAGAEVLQLQRSLATLMRENKILKDEAKIMREKLEQIRKIA